VQPSAKPRIDWVDYAKGICIVLVVMMHSTLGVEKAAGDASWLHPFIDWARPFRMPDFFLISGLFLASRIDRPWRAYLDTKVVHFAYFYILWMTIQYLTKSAGLIQEQGIFGAFQSYLLGFVQPFGTLWFIYLLAVFFAVTKLLRNVPPILVFLAGAALEAAPIETGWLLIDEFAGRFVYFFSCYWLVAYFFAFTGKVDRLATPAILVGLVLWGFGNHYLVAQGFSAWPGVSLIMGFIGAGAVMTTGVLLSRLKYADGIRYCGENSIVIYLAFFLFMAGTRALLLKTGIVNDLGVISLIVTAAGVVGSVLLFWAVRRTPFAFLFKRPSWAKLQTIPEERIALAATHS
jgi:uncharacterized membrane protein YcfT